MTANMPAGVSIYKSCDHLKRTSPVVRTDDELAKKIASEFDVLPAFEESVFNYVHMKHYSLRTNEKMSCCWEAYVSNFHLRVFSPFEFPNNKYFRFNTNTIRYLPGEYIKPSRFHLKPGPGVDAHGQLPIPQDMLMKREKAGKGTTKNVAKNSKNPTSMAIHQTRK